jgi:branched-chain amino acid transport system substrate-binding protein
MKSSRMLRAGAIGALIAALAGAAGVQAADTKAPSGPPVELNVIEALTGATGLAGTRGAQTLSVEEALVNRSGGIGGRPLKIVVSDDGSNAQTDVQLVSNLIAQHVPVILGPPASAGCSAVEPLVQQNGPVLYCAGPGITPAKGGYAFASSTSVDDDQAYLIRYLRDRGWTRIAVMTSLDATGAGADRSIAEALAKPENARLQIVAHEHFNLSDISVNAQMVRIKASNPQVVVTWTTGSPFGTLLHGIHDAGIDVPVVGAPANMTIVALAQYADYLPDQLFFVGLHSMARGGSAPPGVLAKKKAFFDAHEAAGIQPDYPNSLVWDAGWIIIDALRALGPNASAAAIRDYIEKLHDWPGTQGVYDFRDGSQRGLGPSALVMDRWDPGAKQFVELPGPR